VHYRRRDGAPRRGGDGQAASADRDAEEVGWSSCPRADGSPRVGGRERSLGSTGLSPPRRPVRDDCRRMPRVRASTVDPLLVRTRLLKLATRRADHHARLVALGERSRVARAAGAPVRWWLDRRPIVVGEGLGYDLRLWKADLPIDHAHAGLIVRGALERPVQEAFRRLLAPGMTVWDVGANLGFFALVAARCVGPAGRVVAFEPVRASADAGTLIPAAPAGRARRRPGGSRARRRSARAAPGRTCARSEARRGGSRS